MIDYSMIFKYLPGAYVVVAPDSPKFTILEASENYTKVSKKTREELIGHGLFEVFTDSEDNKNSGNQSVKRQFADALQTKLPNKSSITRYDVVGIRGEFETRYWITEVAPVIGKEGEVICLIQNVLEVTELINLGFEVK